MRCALTSALLLALCAILPASAQDALFYVTDRKVAGGTFTSDRNYGHDSITYAMVPTQQVHKQRGFGTPQILTREQFYAALRSALLKLRADEIAVFVHGYNQKPAAAMSSGALFEKELAEPVVVFDWPSRAKLKTYTVDECNIEWAQRHFQLLMQGLEDEFKASKLITISHSMGNRLVYWYLQSRFDKAGENGPEHFKEVVMTSPDVDRATFKNYFWKAAKNTDQLRVYVSDRDKPLRFSSFIYGGYTRLGSGNPQGTEDIRWNMPGTLADAQTINFTTLDDRVIGHSIQYGLISSMHKTGQPGLGLHLEARDQRMPTYFDVVQTEGGQKR